MSSTRSEPTVLTPLPSDDEASSSTSIALPSPARIHRLRFLLRGTSVKGGTRGGVFEGSDVSTFEGFVTILKVRAGARAVACV